MNYEPKWRARAAKARREIHKRRLAKKIWTQKKKTQEDLFEEVKVKMVMRIYGVSCEQAKEIIAGRVAERAAIEAWTSR
jgi:hypothetical protein